MSIKKLLREKGPEVATLPLSAPLSDAVTLLSDDSTSAILITDEDNKLLGLLSSSDIAIALNKYQVLDVKLPVSIIMTNRVVSIDVNESVQQAEELMLEHRIRHVPVTDNGRLSGIVGTLDIMAYRLKNAESEASQLRGYVSAAGVW